MRNSFLLHKQSLTYGKNIFKNLTYICNNMWIASNLCHIVICNNFLVEWFPALSDVIVFTSIHSYSLIGEYCWSGNISILIDLAFGPYAGKNLQKVSAETSIATFWYLITQPTDASTPKFQLLILLYQYVLNCSYCTFKLVLLHFCDLCVCFKAYKNAHLKL